MKVCVQFDLLTNYNCSILKFSYILKLTGVSVPSLHRESTDSNHIDHVMCKGL